MDILMLNVWDFIGELQNPHYINGSIIICSFLAKSAYSNS
jgi:hypothetical protein